MEMTSFEFATSHRIIFGVGKRKNLAAILTSFGRKGVVVRGKSHPQWDEIRTTLQQSGLIFEEWIVSGEPEYSRIKDGIHNAEQNSPDWVLGFGGGSVLDSAKAIAGMIGQPGVLEDYLEVVGAGMALPRPGVPMIAVPTTSGTGSEVTRNAVIGIPDRQVKVSLRSNFLLPQAAIVDPSLMISMPENVIASTGMDALTQVIEPYVSNKANRMTDLFCMEGIITGRDSLLNAFRNGDDIQARTGMAWVSLLGGMALANAGLGAVHGFAAPIGGMFLAPHGAICARLLPGVFRKNIVALQNRNPNSEALERYRKVAVWLTGNSAALAEDGADWLDNLCLELRIQGLTAYGVGPENIPEMVQKAKQASSMKANPVELTNEELSDILLNAL